MALKSLCIVGCTAHKRQSPMVAEDLYSSELFFLSRRYVQANFDHWAILSAKHGLIHPSLVISPYDQKLSSLSRGDRETLVQLVRRQVGDMTGEGRWQVWSICGEEYDALLSEAGVQFHRQVEFNLPIGKKLHALARATDPNNCAADLETVYRIVRRLIGKQGYRTLRDCTNEPLPEAGIYLFLDEAEHRLKDISALRIVRVGTHGVAAGSKASLRHRLRTHMGTLSGEGNHRSSIFRLHVGRSLARAGLFPEVNSWGSTIESRGDVLIAERGLEQEVSKYLSRLLVLFISVPGNSDKSNDRAYLEQNLIALLSNVCKPLDPASHKWLGLMSAKQEIRTSGLWNVNHVYQRYVPDFIDVLSYYVSLTIGTKPAPQTQLAPANWQTLVREDSRQPSFL